MANKLVGTVLLVGSLNVALLAGCADRVTGLAVPESGASMVDATATRKAAPKAGGGGRIDFQAEIGDCVQLGGTADKATIRHAACGGPESNYRIIGRAPTDAQCISDADAYYAETLGGVQTGALCLDIDWAVGSCMDLSGDDPQRIGCRTPTTGGVKVTAIQQDTDDVEACPGDGGFVYNQRHFVVCTEDL